MRPRLFTHNGETHTLREWSKITGIPINTIGQRLERGCSVSDALTKPYQPRKKRKRKKLPPTLCWSCRNARADRCVWVAFGKPVAGWTAVVDTIDNTCGGKRPGKMEKTYCVRKCPRFESEAKYRFKER